MKEGRITSFEELVRLAYLSPEDKAKLMKDNWKLMLSVLNKWADWQSDLRKDEESERLGFLLLEELGELIEVNGKEEKLIRSKPKEGQWWEWEDALDRWKVVSEMADVVVFFYAWLKAEGFSNNRIEEIMSGDDSEYGLLIKNLGERAAKLGISLPEAVILKTGINLQHRPPSLKVEWRKNGFMKRVRLMIGDKDSQMPDLSQIFGLTVLTLLQVPSLANPGSVLNLVEVIDNGDELPSMDKHDYGGLYR